MKAKTLVSLLVVLGLSQSSFAIVFDGGGPVTTPVKNTASDIGNAVSGVKDKAIELGKKAADSAKALAEYVTAADKELVLKQSIVWSLEETIAMQKKLGLPGIDSNGDVKAILPRSVLYYTADAAGFILGNKVVNVVIRNGKKQAEWTAKLKELREEVRSAKKEFANPTLKEGEDAGHAKTRAHRDLLQAEGAVYEHLSERPFVKTFLGRSLRAGAKLTVYAGAIGAFVEITGDAAAIISIGKNDVDAYLSNLKKDIADLEAKIDQAQAATK